MKITIVGKMTGYTAEHTAFDQLRAVASSIMMKEENKDGINTNVVSNINIRRVELPVS